jgi:hypothetical protein
MDDTVEEFRQYLRQFRDVARWTNAKSGPPHSYTVRKWRPQYEHEFLRAVSGIRKYGYPQRFYRATYTYFDLDGLKYWTMGSPLDETIILNRAEIEATYG